MKPQKLNTIPQSASSPPTSFVSLFNLYFLPFSCFFFIALLFLETGFYWMNQIVTSPYMDEIFHFPQLQRYCQGLFHLWDSKLTTPPGLYWFSLLFFPSFFKIQLQTWFFFSCKHLISARFVNLSLAMGLFPVVYLLRHQLALNLTLKENAYLGWNTLNLWLMPLSFFFYFLYYTDTLSTLLVLSSYLAVIKEYRWISAIIIGFSVLVRQTNIFWLAFIAANLLLKKSGYRAHHPSQPWFTSHYAFFADLCLHFRSKLFLTLPYLLILVGLSSLAWTYGIVMGDQEHHTFSLHLAQWNYFLAVFSSLAFPIFFTSPILNLSFPNVFFKIRYTIYYIGALILSLFCVHLGTMAHPFILSDNRHASFYVWRYFFQFYPWAKYMYTPLYSLALLCIHFKLRENQSAVWCTFYYLAVGFSLIPSPLLEFRYFILPILLGRLHLFHLRKWQLCLETLVFLVLNGYVFYLFLFKPFVWQHESNLLQRFMW